MPSRIEVVNLPLGAAKPVVQEQREVWWFDPATVTQVTVASTRYRNAGGSVGPVAALTDGNLTVSACSFSGRSYQNIAAVFATPVDWVSVTARNEARVPTAGASHAGVGISGNVVPDFTGSGPVTVHYKVPRVAGDFVISTAAGSGTLRFYEIRGWLEKR